MPLLGFSVFKEKIQDGSKRQTIRKKRKQPIKVGDTLYLYWHTRQKDCEKLGEATCKEAFYVGFNYGSLEVIAEEYELIDSMPQLDEFAKQDGFESYRAMWDWFSKTYPDAIYETCFQVIRW